MPRKITDHDREIIVKAYKKGRTALDIADFMDVSESSVFKIMARYKNTGQIAGKSTTNAIAKPKDNLMELMFDEKQEEWNNDNETIQERAAFAEKFSSLQQTLPPSHFVFIDAFEREMTHKLKREPSKKGYKPVPKLRRVVTKNISLYSAIEGNTCGFSFIEEERLSLESLANFIKKYCDHKHKEGILSIVIIIKPIAFFLELNVKPLIESYGYHVLLLPLHSPFLIPKENFFIKWRRVLNTFKPEEMEDLMNAMKTATEQVIFNDEENYYNSVVKYLRPCLERVPIQSQEPTI